MPHSDVPWAVQLPPAQSGGGGTQGAYAPAPSQVAAEGEAYPPSPPISAGNPDVWEDHGDVGTLQQAYTTTKDTVDWKARHATKLFINFPNGGRTCSGALIGTKTVLTSAHCAYDASLGGLWQSILVVPGLDGTYMPFGHANAAAVYLSETSSSYGPNNDYAVVILDRHIGHPSMAGHLGYAWMSNTQWADQYVEFYGYPDSVGGGIKQAYSEGFVPCVYDLRVYYEASSSDGASGSGVMPWTTPYPAHVVAVNHGVGAWWDCSWSNVGVGTRITQHRYNFITSVRDNQNIPYVQGDESLWYWHGGYPTAPVGMVAPASGKFDMYIRGTDNNVWMQRYSSSGWSPSGVNWTSIGGPSGGVIGRVAAVSRFSEQVDLFVRQKTGSPTDQEPTPVCTKARNGDSSWWPGPTSWACWSDFKTAVWPAVTSTDPGRLHVFAVGTNGRVSEKAWTSAAGWLAPVDLGGNTREPVAVVSRSQYIWDAFIRDAPTGQLCTKSRNGASFWPGQTSWFCFSGVAVIAGAPTAVASGVNALDVVGVTQAGQLLRMWWRGSGWQGPMLLGGSFGSGGNVAATVAVVSRMPGQLDFFAADLTNGGIRTKAFNGTTWWPSQSGWASLGGDGIDVSAVSFASGRLDVVTRSRLDKAVRHRYWANNLWW